MLWKTGNKIMDHSANNHSFWWSPNEEKWVEVGQKTFSSWRGIGDLIGLPYSERVLPNVPEGDHRFVTVLVSEGEVKNFFPSRFVVTKNGGFGGAPSLLTEAEIQERDRLNALPSCTGNQEAVLDEMNERDFEVIQLPLKLLEGLKRDLPWDLPSETDYGFWQKYKAHGGTIAIQPDALQ